MFRKTKDRKENRALSKKCVTKISKNEILQVDAE